MKLNLLTCQVKVRMSERFEQEMCGLFASHAGGERFVFTWVVFLVADEFQQKLETLSFNHRAQCHGELSFKFKTHTQKKKDQKKKGRFLCSTEMLMLRNP